MFNHQQNQAKMLLISKTNNILVDSKLLTHWRIKSWIQMHTMWFLMILISLTHRHSLGIGSRLRLIKTKLSLMNKLTSLMIVDFLLLKSNCHSMREYCNMLQEANKIFKEFHHQEIINKINNLNSFLIKILVF